MTSCACVIATCGISIIQNVLSRFGNVLDELKRRFKAPFSSVGDALRPEFDRYWLSLSHNPSAIRLFVDAVLGMDDLRRASAELNTIIGALEAEGIGEDGLRHVELICTDTGIGLFSCEVLRTIVAERWSADVKMTKIKDLAFRESLNEALSRLADTFLRAVERCLRLGCRVLTCVSGGFKVVSSFVTVLAFLLRSPVYYAAEGAALVPLKPLPITLRREVEEIIEKYADRCIEEALIDDELRGIGIFVREGDCIRPADWVIRVLRLNRREGP